MSRKHVNCSISQISEKLSSIQIQPVKKEPSCPCGGEEKETHQKSSDESSCAKSSIGTIFKSLFIHSAKSDSTTPTPTPFRKSIPIDLSGEGCFKCGAETHVGFICPIKGKWAEGIITTTSIQNVVQRPTHVWGGLDWYRDGEHPTPEELRQSFNYKHRSMGTKAHQSFDGIETPCPCGGGDHCLEYGEVNSDYEDSGFCDDEDDVRLDRWDSYENMLNPETCTKT